MKPLTRWRSRETFLIQNIHVSPLVLGANYAGGPGKELITVGQHMFAENISKPLPDTTARIPIILAGRGGP